MDGKSSYSKVVLIHTLNSGITALIFPNPFKTDVRVQAAFAVAGNISLLVTDLNGKIVNKQTLIVSEGFNDIPVKGLQHLNAGVYSIEIIQNQKRIYAGKLVKQ